MCEGRRFWGKGFSGRIETAVEGHKRLHIEAEAVDRDRSWNVVFPINYCPFCGEKLKKAEKEIKNG